MSIDSHGNKHLDQFQKNNTFYIDATDRTVLIRFVFLSGQRWENRNDQSRKWRTPIGESNPQAVLTEFDVIEIRRLYKKGVRGFGEISLGRQFGVHSMTIRKIIRGRTWNHV